MERRVLKYIIVFVVAHILLVILSIWLFRLVVVLSFVLGWFAPNRAHELEYVAVGLFKEWKAVFDVLEMTGVETVGIVLDIW